MNRTAVSLALVSTLWLAPVLSSAAQHERGRGETARHAAESKAADGSKAAEKPADQAQDDAMRRRRDERKQIQETYREEVEAGGERVEGKKPWWKFWGSDDG